MHFKRIAYIAVPILALLGLVFWRLAAKNASDSQLSKAQKARASAPLPVKLATAGPATILASLDLLGQIESPYVVKLAAKTSARIDYLQVREGDPVKPGDVLVKLDPSAVEGEILTSESSLAEAKSRLAQAVMTQTANNTGVNAQVLKDKAGLNSSLASYNQTVSSVTQQVAAAESAVTDGVAKVAAAQSALLSAQADLNSAKASQENAQAKFTRMQTLYNQGFAAAQDVDDARTAADVGNAGEKSAENKVASAQSAVRSATAQLDGLRRQLKIAQNKAKSDVAAAQATLEQSKATLNVSSANTSQIGAYQANIEALKQAVDAAQGQLTQSLSKRADSRLASTIEGVVTSRQMDPGTIATAGQPILTIQYLKWLYVTVPVPVDNSQQVHMGDVVNFTVDGLSKVFAGKVAEINPAADPQSRQFTVRLRMENPDGILRPGMYAHVKLQIGKVDAAVAAPREAVTTDNSGVSKAYVVDADMKAKLTPVVLGAQSATMVEIKSGVEAGQKLVVLSSRLPKDGQSIVDADKAPKGGSSGSRGSRGGNKTQ